MKSHEIPISLATRSGPREQEGGSSLPGTSTGRRGTWGASGSRFTAHRPAVLSRAVANPKFSTCSSRVWCPGARRQLLLPSPPRSFAGALSLCRTADHSPPGDCMDPAAWRGPWVLTGCGEDLCPQQFGDICGLRTGGLQESEPDTHTQAGVSPGMARDGTRDAEGAVASRAAHVGWLPAPRTPENQTRFCF